MIDGVSTQFCVTDWNSSVATPWVNAAITTAPATVSRRSIANSKEPRTNRSR